MKKFIENSLEKAISYSEYRTLVKGLLDEGKSTGPNQSEDLLNYSLLNDKRMKRLDKTMKLSEITQTKLAEIKEAQTWLVITEGWCGDAAQNLPVINKLAEENDNIHLLISSDKEDYLREALSILKTKFIISGRIEFYSTTFGNSGIM